MFRRLLTYQLIFAVAVGPLLCCCTTGRLLASCSQPVGSAPSTVTPDPTVRTTSTCCAHKHEPAKPIPDRGHSDPQPVPSKPGEKCPCKDGLATSNMVQTESVSPEVTTFLRALSFDLAAPFALLDFAARLAPLAQEFPVDPGSNASTLSTADLLYAHHNLRC